MPPGSLSTLAVMKPGPITAKKAASRNQTILHPVRRARCGRVAGGSWAGRMQAMRKVEPARYSLLPLVGQAARDPEGTRVYRRPLRVANAPDPEGTPAILPHNVRSDYR